MLPAASTSTDDPPSRIVWSRLAAAAVAKRHRGGRDVRARVLLSRPGDRDPPGGVDVEVEDVLVAGRSIGPARPPGDRSLCVVRQRLGVVGEPVALVLHDARDHEVAVRQQRHAGRAVVGVARPAEPALPEQRPVGRELQRRPVVALAVREARDVHVARAVDDHRRREVAVVPGAVVALGPARRSVGRELHDEVVVVLVEDHAVVDEAGGVHVAGGVDRDRARLAADAAARAVVARGPAPRAVRAELDDRERARSRGRLDRAADVAVAGAVGRDRRSAVVRAAVEADDLRRLAGRGTGVARTTPRAMAISGCTHGDGSGLSGATAGNTGWLRIGIARRTLELHEPASGGTLAVMRIV